MTFKATQEFIKKLDYDFCENMFRKELSKLGHSTGLSNGHPLGTRELSNEDFNILMTTKKCVRYKNIITDFSHYIEKSYGESHPYLFKAVAVFGDEYIDTWMKNRNEWSDRTDKTTTVYWTCVILKD